MNTAIFDVEEYEAIHGPIETWDCEAYRVKKNAYLRHKREYKRTLRKQKVLGVWVLILAIIFGCLGLNVPEMYTIAFSCFYLGCWMIFATKEVIY